MADYWSQLCAHLAELTDLRYTLHLAQWDQRTMMPPRGGRMRADLLASLQGMLHERFVSDRTGWLLDTAGAELDGGGRAAGQRIRPRDVPTPSALGSGCAARDLDDDDALSLVRLVRRRWEKARRVPSELTSQMAWAASVGEAAWVDARARSDFAAFKPYLERNVELTRRYVDCFDCFDCGYDALLDDYEPGLGSAEITRLFAELRSRLVPLIAWVGERVNLVDESCLRGNFPLDRQRRLVSEVVHRMGFEDEGWRLDDTAHPFASRLGPADVRITTRWDEADLATGLFIAMHECGHGLYEAGISPALRRTPLGSGDAFGLHESQSRIWENMVGRSAPFARFLAPRIAELFPESAGALDADTLYRASNRVHPSHIRVGADEATYGMHIVLRFELEQELIDGRLTVADLPEAWNDRFERYLGLKVTDDARGVLQDSHWAGGLIGYFPTYAIGDLVAGQLWERVRADLPDLDDQIAHGDLLPLRDWLREHVHRHGSKFTATEVLDRVVGAPLTVEPFMSYLRAKLTSIYGP